jgi:hypothetical protein
VAAGGRRNGDGILAAGIAAGQTIAAAAAAAGVSERTAARRPTDPEFKQHVAELRAGMVQLALGRLSDGMAGAASTLRELLSDPSGTVRLGAARSLLELSTKLRESVDLENRLAALEAALEQRKGATS